MSTPIEELEAGDYEVVAEFYDEMQRDPETKEVIFTRYRKGATVPLGLAEARRLYQAGAVVLPNEREKAIAAAAFAQYQAALAALPDSIREQVLAAQAGVPAEDPSEEEPAGGEDDPEKPKRTAPKGDWVAFAVSQGADEDEAEAATKEDLIATYGA